jgi:arylsulfatase A-like enzyme
MYHISNILNSQNRLVWRTSGAPNCQKSLSRFQHHIFYLDICKILIIVEYHGHRSIYNHLNMHIQCWLLAVLALISVATCTIFAEETETSPTINTTYIDNELNNAKKPNIVIILADDLGTGDVPFFWNGLETSKVQMPHLQQLADKGITFTDAHSSPLCAPSRYMLLSGNYPHRGSKVFGTWNINSGFNQFTKYQKSIAETLRTAGYDTAVFGKWHLGGKVPPNGIQNEDGNLRNLITEEGHDWTLPLIEGPGYLGFDRSYITTAGIQSPPYSFFRDDFLTTTPSNAKYWNGGTHQMTHGESVIIKRKAGEGDPSWDSSAYDMILVNETNAFIDNHLEKRPNDPFFAYVALGAVHAPHSPADVYLDGSPIKNQYEIAHLDMLGAMDKAVGSIVSMIEEKNLAEETIIIFASDNGGLNKVATVNTGHRTSGPLRGAKRDIWEGGHRVPFIIRYDSKFKAGVKRKKMVGLNDIYATICELVGIDIPVGSAQDSVSFASYIMKAKNKQGLRKYLGMFQLDPSRAWQHAIRKGNLKLVHHPQNNTYEAYNLKKDISETKNIIDKPWVRKKIPAMFEVLKKIGPCPDHNDHVGHFSVSGLGEDHNCEWFQQDGERCEQHIEGELLCPSICSRFRTKCYQHGMYGNIFSL